MTYVLSIDWLAIHCHWCPPSAPVDSPIHSEKQVKHEEWEPSETDGSLLCAYPWRYKLADYGTRQFSRLYYVSIPNAEGGWDDFAEIQASPHSGILNPNSVIIRFVNRALYTPDFWTLADRLLLDNDFVFKGISRIDLCADQNDFFEIAPLALIEGFAAKKLRHVGRGVGALYFNHGVMHDRLTGTKDYGVRFNGLSFGTHTSDCRVYLYNKTFELLTQGDKPWIRDRWTQAGLDVTCVWRLEVSIKSAGCKFKCKQSGEKVEITTESAKDDDELSKIFHTFEHKLFAFVKNRRGITNISREPRIQLYDGKPMYIRGAIRNISSGKRFEKMFIKALYQLGDLYRGSEINDDALLAQEFAVRIASATDQTEWMSRKLPTWERPTHK